MARRALRLEITYEDPKSLTLWDENPRRNDAAAKRLVALIEEHGFGQPVTVREEDGIVYKGNTRVKAAILIGLRRIPVMRRSYPTVEDAIEDAIADNRAHEWSEWDEDRLGDALAKRDEVDMDKLARRTGLEPTEIEGLRDGTRGVGDDAPPDEFPEFDEGVPTEHRCPKCGYEWSGKKR